MADELPVIDLTDVPAPRGPWIRGKVTVDVDELAPGPEGMSLYKLPGSRAGVVVEAIDTLPSVLAAAAVLWRAVANGSGACPICGARPRVSSAADDPARALVVHGSRCPISNEALRAAWPTISSGDPLPADLPPLPRRWRVRPPRLAVNTPKKRRR